MAGGTGIVTFAETKNGKLTPVARETVGAARRLADEKSMKVISVLIGDGIGSLADDLIKLGADKVIICENQALAGYLDESYCKILAEISKSEDAAVTLGGATFVGKSLFPRLATSLSSGLAADVTSIGWDGDNILAVRPAYGGKALIQLSPAGPGPQMATLRPKAFPEPSTDDGRSGEKIELPFDESKHGSRAKILESVSEGGQEISLTDADIIVSGGRGIKEAANYKMIEELAGVLGAAAGASRAVVDAGWVSYSHQVGQTGKTVNPKLYIACGISGAIQHLVGMQSSKTIVAINRDAEAPIFKVATYGIVGDIFEILPRLTEKLKEMAN
ncbi:MAG: electron transfer flavoprotein subunit alpha/FixB family protein [Candidatus Zixiibacteriota bacterium]|nr:MAG: electron transfer flavoprotein subunit alpha/FixB family protein [candidate division Zixibacteria bacterium]